MTGRRGMTAGAAVALVVGALAVPAAQAQQNGALDTTVLGYSDTATHYAVGAPQISLSTSTFSENGEHELTVTGSGFTDDSVLGTRPPLSGKNAGVYVVFGKFADTWRPSENASGSARPVAVQRWAVLAEDIETIGGPEAGAVELRADGTFTATMTISKAAADEAAGSNPGNYGIYVYPGSGAKHAAWELSSPITFTNGAVPPPATGSLGS